MLRELRPAIRTLARAPVFTAVAILSLALGIAATTTIATLFDVAVLRSLQLPDENRLVELSWPYNRLGAAEPLISESRLAERIEVAREIVVQAVQYQGQRYEGELVYGQVTTPGLIPMLGGRLVAGRWFVPTDQGAGAPRVVILNHAYWLRRFNGDAGIVGRELAIEDTAYTVIGVLAPRFKIENTKESVYFPLPVRLSGSDNPRILVSIMAKLKPGITRAALASEWGTIVARSPELVELARAVTVRSGSLPTLTVAPVNAFRRQITARSLTPGLGAAMFLLLIGCANVANLSVARGVSRRKDFLVRSALGASWSALARSAAAEAIVVSVAGGALGIGLATVGLPIALSLLGSLSWEIFSVSLDLRAMGLSLLVVTITALATAIWPALVARRTDTASGLRDSTGGTTRGRAGALVQRVLIVSQVSAAFLLLTGAGLLTKSLAKMLWYDPGFETDHLFQVQLQARSVSDTAKARAEVMSALASLDETPGLLSRAAISALFGPITIDPSTEIKATFESAMLEVVAFAVQPGYLETLGVPLVAGRTFTPADRSSPPTVAIVTEEAARAWWPNAHGQVLGQRVKLAAPDSTGPWVTVIGVAKSMAVDEFQALARPHPAAIMVPMTASPPVYVSLVARFGSAPGQVVDAVRAIGPKTNTKAVISGNVTADIARATGDYVGNTVILDAFAALGILLAAIGIVGVVAHGVARRTRELGIRIALGARARQVVGAVIAEAAVLGGIGVGIGYGLSLAFTRVLTSVMLFTSVLDPWVFWAAGVLFTGLILLACYVPARKAVAIEPTVALKAE